MSFKNCPSSRVSVFLSAGSGFEAVSAISKTLHNLPSHTLTHTHADAHKRRNASTLASPHAHTNLPSLFPLCFELRFSLSPALHAPNLRMHPSHIHRNTSRILFHFGCVLTSLPFGGSIFPDALLCLRVCGNIRSSPSCGWWVESKCE